MPRRWRDRARQKRSQRARPYVSWRAEPPFGGDSRRGFRIGSAEVSVKHANFIQADPGGRASDVVAVMDHVQAVVQQKFGFNLRSEVRLIGWAHEISTRGSDE